MPPPTSLISPLKVLVAPPVTFISAITALPISIGLLAFMLLSNVRVAPTLNVREPVPRPVLLLSLIFPADKSVPPEYVLAPDRINVPDPVFVRSDPAPEMIPLNVGELAPIAMVAEPDPAIAILFETLKLFESSSMVPSDIDKVPVPRPLASLKVICPADNAVPPE